MWFDSLELRDCEALAVYADGPGEGLAAATVRKMGKGRIIVLGTLPSKEDLIRMLAPIATEAGVEPPWRMLRRICLWFFAPAGGRGADARGIRQQARENHPHQAGD